MKYIIFIIIFQVSTISSTDSSRNSSCTKSNGKKSLNDILTGKLGQLFYNFKRYEGPPSLVKH